MPTIVHFDLPTDEPERAKKFYQELFGWTFMAPPEMENYLFVETKKRDGSPGVPGGMGKRTSPDERILNYVGVDSIDESIAKAQELGGKINRPKMPVPGWGWLAVLEDTEKNLIGLWQEDKSAK
jgi:predicted enzyme related to lactoylglutathione lyase